MPPAPVQPEWVQYGSFGLIAFLVVVGLPGSIYGLKIIFTQMFDAHKAAIQTLTNAFTEEANHCRDEREKDRQVRHDLRNTLQQLTGSIDRLEEHH